MASRNLADREKWSVPAPESLEPTYRQCLDWVTTAGWTTIRDGVLRAFGGFEKVRSVEVGAGLGKTSMIFSLLGAKATILDYNEEVLASAETVHRAFGAKTRFVHANALDLPSDLRATFDVSMSFGTCEHFDGEERETIIRAHALALREGGIGFIWVPNKLGVLFQVTHGLYKLVRGWDIWERNFWRWELQAAMSRNGFHDVRVGAGTTLRRDYRQFVVGDIGGAIRRRIGRNSLHATHGSPDTAIPPLSPLRKGGEGGLETARDWAREIALAAMQSRQAFGPLDAQFAEAHLGVGIR